MQIDRDSSNPMSELRKHNVEVSVRTAYIDAQSAPESSRYVFAYTITITNAGSVPAKLLTRHWVIKDANEKVQEVRGVGVVGEQPHLSPGMSFEYTSGTVLETPFGTMHGSYQMIADDGTEFDAEIPPFLLSTPRQLH
jgi:ApaG protein